MKTRYVKTRIWEWLLCVAVSCSISLILSNGFYISPEHQGNYLAVAAVTAAVMALCFFGAYDRRSTVIALAAGAAALIAGVVAIQLAHVGSNVFRDQEGNIWLWLLILCATALAVFFLCRTRTGTGILFVTGAFLAAAMQFLYETVHLPLLLLFLCSGGAAYIYKQYQHSVLDSETVKTAFGRTFALSAALCLLAIALSAGLFYGIVKPMNPPAHELKLITKYKSLEVLEKMGIVDTSIINDSEERTDNVKDNQKDTSQEGEKEDKSQGDAEHQKDENVEDNPDNPSSITDSPDSLLFAIRYALSELSPLWWAFMALTLAALVIVLKLYLRQRWLEKVREQPRKTQVILLYQFYLKKLRHLKIRKAPEETPLEFSRRAEPYMGAFNEGSEGFPALTEIFVKARYGNQPVEPGEHASYLEFHRMFYKRCRKHLGSFKYICKFFIL